MSADTIRAELVPTNFYTRYRCHCCGGATEKVGVLCEVPKSHPTHAGFRVCEQCLKAGDVLERMLEHAAALDAEAAELRDTADRLQVPSYAEWEHADRVTDACEVMYHVADDFDTPKAEVLAWPRERQMALIERAKAIQEANKREYIAEYGDEARANLADFGDPF